MDIYLLIMCLKWPEKNQHKQFTIESTLVTGVCLCFMIPVAKFGASPDNLALSGGPLGLRDKAAVNPAVDCFVKDNPVLSGQVSHAK